MINHRLDAIYNRLETIDNQVITTFQAVIQHSQKGDPVSPRLQKRNYRGSSVR